MLLASTSLHIDANLSVDEAQSLDRRLRFARSISDQLTKFDPDNFTDYRRLLARTAHYVALFADRANPGGPLGPGLLEFAETAVQNDPSVVEYQQLLARLRQRTSPVPPAPKPRPVVLQADEKPRLIGTWPSALPKLRTIPLELWRRFAA
jgi:hypothetical protein